MIDIEVFIKTFIVLALFGTAGVGLYGVVAKPHATKKIISLTILGDTVNALAILLGYRYPGGIPPVYTGQPPNEFVGRAVDPLPQALVLTAIVIGMAVNLLIIYIALQTYRLYGTLDTRLIKKLRG